MLIAIIGTGYVGLTTAVALASLGHEVVAVDKDNFKIDLLSKGKSPIHEHNLENLMHIVEQNLKFASEAHDAVTNAEIIIIAVGTPPKKNGNADICYVETAATEIAQSLKVGGRYTIVVKSTVPVGTNRRVSNVVNRVLIKRGIKAQVYTASNPEFLREGMALQDTLYPDRIVVGAEQPEAVDALRRLYRPVLEQTFTPPPFLPRPEGYILPPLITTDPTSAEMIKYAANAFLALKISFINEIAGLCEKVDANVKEVARGIGMDQRIGSRFLQAGLGWGGSCFPKDSAALRALAAEYNYTMPILEASRLVNVRQQHIIIEKLQSALKVLRGRTIAVLGLSFKPETDDVRESPALNIIHTLLELEAHVKAHDPVAMDNAHGILEGLDVEFCNDPYSAVRGCDAIVLATEWKVYGQLDLSKLASCMRIPVLVDGRNLYNPKEASRAGFIYIGIGRDGLNYSYKLTLAEEAIG